jgi:peptide deformylase
MPVQPIRLFPDSILRKPCEPIRHFDQNLADLIKDLIQTMKKQPHGIGIAAPQIGVAKQVAIVDVSARVPGAMIKILVNPKILELHEERASREGCMSVPDYTANLKRYDRIRLIWQDEKGMHQEDVFTGIEAVCIQHEVDHLNGVLFVDRVVSLKRDMIPRQKSSKRP